MAENGAGRTSGQKGFGLSAGDCQKMEERFDTMVTIQQYHTTIEINLQIGPDIVDITNELSHFVSQSGIDKGVASVFVVGSTGSITTIEHEPGVVADLKDAVDRMAPRDRAYQHELAWHDGNGHSHVQAALIGPSMTIPIRSGKLRLGTWQQVVIINHDNKSRKRVVEVTITGTHN